MLIADEYLLKTASSRQLLRMRKDELIHLYTSAGLSPLSSFESLTKPELVEAIISSRDEDENDGIELPPSSPRGSEYSGDGDVDAAEVEEAETQEADDGNIAGDEETDIGASHSKPSRRGSGGGNALRRRATVNDLGRNMSVAMGRKTNGQIRSLSTGRIGGTEPVITRYGILLCIVFIADASRSCPDVGHPVVLHQLPQVVPITHRRIFPLPLRHGPALAKLQTIQPLHRRLKSMVKGKERRSRSSSAITLRCRWPLPYLSMMTMQVWLLGVGLRVT